MKRRFEVIKNTDKNEVDTLLGMQDENARKLLESRERLLALNAIFDAALTGEAGKHVAKNISGASEHCGESFIRHLNDNKKIEH